jgi:hypothetical protein
VNDEARRNNQNLPGMGGVFNLVNLHVYHYAGNNPVKYVDPDGNEATKSQAGTWGQARGIIERQSDISLRNLRYTEGDASGIQIGPFGGATGLRYIYTKKGGWIDLGHFFQIGAKMQERGVTGFVKFFARLFKPITKLFVWHETKKVENDQNELSSWAYDDGPTNWLGAKFYLDYYKDDEHLLESLDKFFKKIQASAPDIAPNLSEMQEKELTEKRFPENRSLKPVYTMED